MSNRRRPANQPDKLSTEWLLCDDCNSQVHEEWYGQAPRLVLSLEIEHSETCPVWRHDGRELGVAFLPKDETSTEPTPTVHVWIPGEAT